MAYLLLIASFVLKNHVRVITLRGLGKPRQIRDNIACCLLTAIPLIVFFVIRDLHVGTDTIGIYQNIYFNGYGLNGWTPYLYEGLFKYLIILSAKIVPSFRFFLLVSGCIICLSFSFYFVKQRENMNAAIAFLLFSGCICPATTSCGSRLPSRCAFTGPSCWRKSIRSGRRFVMSSHALCISLPQS